MFDLYGSRLFRSAILFSFLCQHVLEFQFLTFWELNLQWHALIPLPHFLPAFAKKPTSQWQLHSNPTSNVTRTVYEYKYIFYEYMWFFGRYHDDHRHQQHHHHRLSTTHHSSSPTSPELECPAEPVPSPTPKSHRHPPMPLHDKRHIAPPCSSVNILN